MNDYFQYLIILYRHLDQQFEIARFIKVISVHCDIQTEYIIFLSNIFTMNKLRITNTAGSYNRNILFVFFSAFSFFLKFHIKHFFKDNNNFDILNSFKTEYLMQSQKLRLSQENRYIYILMDRKFSFDTGYQISLYAKQSKK